jgi:hypothetical protein
MDASSQRIEFKIDVLGPRMGELETRMEGLDGRMIKLETRMDSFDARLGKVEVDLAALGPRLEGKIVAAITSATRWNIGAMFTMAALLVAAFKVLH